MFNIFTKTLGLDTVGTIIKSRLEMIGSAITVGIAAVAQYGWVPYITDAATPKTMGLVAAVVFVNGLVTEIIRRYNSNV